MRFHHGREGDNGLAAANQALALDPSIAEAYAVRARNLVEQNDFAGAEREIERGLDVDRDSWDVIREAARLSMIQRKVEQATNYYQRAAEIDESDFHSCMMLVTCYQALGRLDRMHQVAETMKERAERVVRQDPLNAAALGVIAGALAILGDLESARECHQRAMVIDPDNINMPYNFACVLGAWVGEKEAALDLIEPLFTRVSRSLLLTALTDPDMDSLRDHPRFIRATKDAIKRTGVTPEMVSADIRGLVFSDE
jgi:adenylate cyclase